MRISRTTWTAAASLAAAIGIGAWWSVERVARPAAASVTPASAPRAGGSVIAEVFATSAPTPAARAIGVRAGVPAREIIGSSWTTATAPDLLAFRGWTERYLAAGATERAALLGEGRALAAKRRAVLATLIREDPQAALAAAVPMIVRQKLPVEITTLLEARVAGRGELALNAGTPAPGGTLAEPVFRSALVGGEEFRAFVYGRRAAQATLASVSIVGVAVDGALAVSESPLRLLEAGELADGRAVDGVCDTSGDTTPVPTAATPLNVASPVAVELDGRIQILCDPAHLAPTEAQLVARENDHTLTAADSGQGSSGVAGRPTKAWTHGVKKLLLIRVDFSDLPGVPAIPYGGPSLTEDVLASRINDAGWVRDYYEQNSYGKTTLQLAAPVNGDSADITDVLRLPQTAAYYAINAANSTLHSDARALANAAGFAVAGYDRVGVVFANLSSLAGSQITYGGLGNINGANFWINGWFDLRVVAHEIGHNYGLQHANRWKVTDGNPVSPDGTSVEYGDTFDVMGTNGGIDLHFSQWNKSILQWIPDDAVTTVANGGTYRVYRFDHASADLAQPRALKVLRDATRDYWIGYRRATTNASLDNGAYVLWGYNTNVQGNLLDMTTPGDTPSDAALAVGATFTDTAAGVTLRPVAKGGSGAEEYLDVQVVFQPRVQWARSAVVVDEQLGAAVLTLTRTANLSGAVTVNYATSAGTATSADFVETTGAVTWSDGEGGDRTVSIPLVGDTLVEGAENFTITLTGVTGGVIVGDAAATVTIADAGARDTTFAADFINNTVNAIVVQPDGAILVGGWFGLVQDGGFTNYPWAGVARVTAAGKIDTEFAIGTGAGGVTSPAVHGMAAQSDGRVVVGGAFTTMQGVARGRVARLLADGSLDTTFATGAGANDTVYAVLALPDGKTLVGGAFTTYDGVAREYLARLNADGSLDTSFVGPNFGSTSGWRVEALACQPDGKIIVAGSFYFEGFSTLKYGVCRVAATGALDATFSGVTQGAHLAGSTNISRNVRRVAVQADGKILIAGNFTAFNNTARGGLARLTATGALDTTFAPTSDGSCDALLLQPDGRIMVGGSFTTFNGASVSRLVRLSSAGVVDTAFVAAGGSAAKVISFALQPDGRVVMGTEYGSYQGATPSRPLWRFFPGLPGLPGTVHFDADAIDVLEGQSATVTVSRTGGTLGALTVGYAVRTGTAGAGDFTTASGTLTWADGEGGAKTISVATTADAVADGGEAFTVNLGAPEQGSVIYGERRQATVTITELAGFALWRSQQFSTAEVANGAVSGASADPDGDGLNNLLEYAFGASPKSFSTNTSPTISVQVVDGATYLTIVFRRRVAATDLTYSPQVSSELNTGWTAGAVQVGAAVANGDGTETVTFRDTVAIAAGVRRFMRLNVTSP